MAYQPISTGALPATIPNKVHEMDFRHTADEMTPIKPM